MNRAVEFRNQFTLLTSCLGTTADKIDMKQETLFVGKAQKYLCDLPLFEIPKCRIDSLSCRNFNPDSFQKYN